jgi:hypothetical protein
MIKISKVPVTELHKKYIPLQDKIDSNRKLMFSMLSNISHNFTDNQSRYITDAIINNTLHNTETALKSYKELFDIKTIVNK